QSFQNELPVDLARELMHNAVNNDVVLDIRCPGAAQLFEVFVLQRPRRVRAFPRLCFFGRSAAGKNSLAKCESAWSPLAKTGNVGAPRIAKNIERKSVSPRQQRRFQFDSRISSRSE